MFSKIYKSTLLKKALLITCSISCMMYATAQNNLQEIKSTLPNFKNEFGNIKNNMPGCAVGIVLDGEVIFEQYYGLSNIQYQVKNNQNTLFNLGSVSKHMTAAVFFRLEKDGLISRDDKIIKFYPQGPKWFENITIGHLIEHKSGMPDYVNDPEVAPKFFQEIRQSDEIGGALIVGLPISHENIVNTVINQMNNLSAPVFDAGLFATYSNTGYLLLGDIIEIATKKNLKYWADHYIFKPYDLNNMYVHDNSSADLKWAATGYIRSPYGKGYSSLVETLVSFGDTGVITSLNDFVSWMDVLTNSKEQDSIWNGFLIDFTETDPQKTHLGLYDNGLFVEVYKENTIYTHAGQSLDSMTSNFWVSPEKKVGYVQMCNTTVSKVPSRYKVFKYVEEYLKLQEGK